MTEKQLLTAVFWAVCFLIGLVVGAIRGGR
jgi:hypothetical protein